jgi:hypothetical protein
MKKNQFGLIAVIALLLTTLLYTACASDKGRSAETKQPGVHKMGSSPMSDAKHPGKLPDSDGGH